MADILVIEDDQNLGFSLQSALRKSGHECRWVDSAQAAVTECHRHPPDLALMDLCLPDSSGLELIEKLHSEGWRFPIIVMTAFGNVTSAVAAIKKGAADFVEKPQSVAELCRVANQFFENQKVSRQLENIEPARRAERDELDLIGQSPGMRKVLAGADKFASLPLGCGAGVLTLMILGETGTGKEMLARYVHNRSSPRSSNFVHVNCTAVPAHLLEAEFFGHEKGSFTDARTRRDGLLTAARGGTLFLDEIGDMPLPMQSKLLVAIETGRFRRVGSTAEETVELRVIAATNQHLQRKIKAGEFRSDLYHRLTMFSTQLPPLRERGDDILLLADYLLKTFCRRLGRGVPVLHPDTQTAIQKYAWPGNVREMAHLLLRALVLDETDVMMPAALNLPEGTSTPASPPSEAALEFDFSNGRCTFETVEKRLLQAAMDHADHNITKAAKLLGMTRGTLRYRLEKLRLDFTDTALDAG